MLQRRQWSVHGLSVAPNLSSSRSHARAAHRRSVGGSGCNGCWSARSTVSCAHSSTWPPAFLFYATVSALVVWLSVVWYCSAVVRFGLVWFDLAVSLYGRVVVCLALHPVKLLARHLQLHPRFCTCSSQTTASPIAPPASPQRLTLMALLNRGRGHLQLGRQQTPCPGQGRCSHRRLRAHESTSQETIDT